MNIVIKNLNDEIITLEQAKLIKYFEKQFFDNGELKKIEYYFGTKISLSYFLLPPENINIILNSLYQNYDQITFYFNKQLLNNFTVFEWEIYKGLIKKSKGKIVEDSSNRLIAHQEIDMLTSLVKTTNKFYYLQNLGPFSNIEPVLNNGRFEFNYNEANVASGISIGIDLPGFEDEEYYIENNTAEVFSNWMIAAVFDWTSLPYYHSSLPLIP